MSFLAACKIGNRVLIGPRGDRGIHSGLRGLLLRLRGFRTADKDQGQSKNHE